MDTFTEELVVRQNTRQDIAKLAAYLLGIFSVPAIFILLGLTVNGYFIIVAICAAFFGVYGSYYLVTGLYREFEYAVTNSNITIDKVIAKRNRKRVISVDIKRLNTLKKFKESGCDKKTYRKVFKASITPDGDDVYAAEMHLDKFGGECLLLFSPGEKTLEAMKPYLKNTIKAEMFKNSAKSAAASPKAKNSSENNNSPKTDKQQSASKTPENADISKNEKKSSAQHESKPANAASSKTDSNNNGNNKPENGNNNQSKANNGTSSKKKKRKK